MFYDDRNGIIQEESTELQPFTTKGMFVIVILSAVILSLLCNFLYGESGIELSATALRTCAGCVGQ